MKKWFAILITALLIVSLAACGADDQTKSADTDDTEPEEVIEETEEEIEEEIEEPEEEPEETPVEEEPDEEDPDIELSPMPGSWDIPSRDAVKLPDDVQKSYKEAMEGFPGDVKPVAFVAKQLVGGTNYMILCESTSEYSDPGYQMVVIYVTPKGSAMVSTVKEFDIQSFLVGDGLGTIDEGIVSGWEIPENYTKEALPEDAQTAFDKATAKIKGDKPIPMLLLGTQTVAGTNYTFLCAVPASGGPMTKLQVVAVSVDLDDNVKLVNVCNVDPANFSE